MAKFNKPFDLGRFEIGIAIRAARKSEHISQGEFAQKLGISAPMLCAIEAGRRNPGSHTFAVMMEKLGMRVILIPTNVATAAEVAAEVKKLVAAGQTGEALRRLGRFATELGDLYRERPVLALVLCEDTPSAGKLTYQAALAGIVETVCEGANMPAWVRDPQLLLPEHSWFVAREPITAELRESIPEPLFRRGVMLPRRLLWK